MKKTARYLFKEEIFIPLCLFAITILGLAPTIAHLWFHTPPDRLYTFAHNYMADYYQYLSWMKDGADGKMLITSRFSSDDFPRQFVYFFYPFFGFIFGKLGLPLYLGYTFLRVILSISKLLVIYLLISEIFKKSAARKVIFALVVFLPAFFTLSPPALWLERISSIDVLQRTFFIPHDLATACLLMLGCLFVGRFLRKGGKREKKIKNLVISSVCFFTASITNPAHLLIFYLFIGAGFALYFVQQKSSFLKFFVAGIISLALGLPLIIYYQRLFQTVLPFSWMFEQQKGLSLNVSFWQYLVSLGPAGFLFVLGVPSFFKSKKFLAKVILAWAIIPFVLFPLLGRAIPISQERIFELSHFIPLGILAGAGLIGRKGSEEKGIKGTRGIKTAIIIILIAFCLPYYYIALQFQVKMFAPPFFNIYLPKTTIQAYEWLDKNTPDESVVATSYFTGNMLPAWSHNRVVHGHDFVTYRSVQRLAEVNELFSPATKPARLEEILRAEKVKYLLFTPETPRFEVTNFSQIQRMSLVYKNEDNLVFEYKGNEK